MYFIKNGYSTYENTFGNRYSTYENTFVEKGCAVFMREGPHLWERCPHVRGIPLYSKNVFTLCIYICYNEINKL